MGYSILIEEKKLNQVLNALEYEAGAILVSMESFNKLWNDIYEGFEKNNLEIPESFDSLIISIYKDWKDKSNLAEQIEGSFDRIFQKLNIAKKKKMLNSNIIAEINQEVQELSKVVKAFEIDKNAIEYLVTGFKKSRQSDNLSSKRMAFWPLCSKRFGINTITGAANALIVWNASRTSDSDNTSKCLIRHGCLAMVVAVLQYSYINRKIKSWIHDNNLSKLSQSSIEMNTKLKNFGTLVSIEARKVQPDTSISNDGEETEDYSDAFDIEIDSLIRIAQKLRYCFENIQQKTSQNENNARKLILKHNPDFLIKIQKLKMYNKFKLKKYLYLQEVSDQLL